MDLFFDLLTDDRGASTNEYALLVAMLVLGTMAAVTTLSGGIVSTCQTLGKFLGGVI